LQVNPSEVDQNAKLGVIKALVSERRLHVSKKVQAMVARSEYSLDDIRCCLQTATAIHKVEADEVKQSYDGFKYTLYGRDTNRSPFYTCGKILLDGNEERLFLIMTAHKRTHHE